MTTTTVPPQPFATTGKQTDSIPVEIGYRIVELFSDGLYASGNKAIEELVSNSFDAGAQNVHVVMSADRADPSAVIAVLDDGVSMDAKGLRQHWLIGESNKRTTPSPRGRKQIGKFGIGKLATFVLANHFTHICKRGGKFFAVTMDYTQINQVSGGITAQQKISLPLRELSEKQVKACLPSILLGDKEGHKAIKMFGPSASETWTLAIMSALKPMATDIRKRQLAWVLRTAMPLRDDFKLYLDGERLTSSKDDVKPTKRWILGQDLVELPTPSPDDLEVEEDPTATEPHRYGFTHPKLGRITGYAEIYQDSLTGGKSDEVGRSNGFFIYVRDRLVNIDDERFGINPDKLRHGTFVRFRAVVNIDRLDEELRSTRETVREGDSTTLARNLVHAIFNFARNELQELDDSLKPGTRSRGRISQAPGSLTRRPVLALLRQSFTGNVTPKYLRIPPNIPKDQQSKFIEDFRTKAESDEGLVQQIKLEHRAPDDGIATFDVVTSTLELNTLHPFVAGHLQENEQDDALRLLAMAEVLTEAYLYDVGLKPTQVNEVLQMRDELLRHFARTAKRTASVVAQMLEEAANDENRLENELVAAFDSMGFSAVHIGGPDKPDGIATAHLGGSEDGVKRGYKISLEAKSKEKPNTKVTARTVHVSGIVRHRSEYECNHAVVVGQDFQLGRGNDPGAVTKEIQDDLEHEKRAGTNRTITLLRIRDLARLVRLVPLKGLGLDQLRDLFNTCITPEQTKDWIDKLEAQVPKQAPFPKILKAIWSLQGEQPDEPVEFAALRLALRRDYKIDLTKPVLNELCSAMAQIVPQYVTIRGEKIELTQRPDKILEAAGTVLQQYPDTERTKSVFRL